MANVKCKTRPTEPSMGSLIARPERAKLRRLTDSAAESHERIVIAGKCGSSALSLSVKASKAGQETRHLLSIPGMRKSIRDAMAEPLGNRGKEPRW